MKNKIPSYLTTKAAQIRLVIFDVDGVLTDGKLYYGPQGEETKVFHVHDGLGMKMLLQHDIQIAIITSRATEAVKNRMQELGIPHVYQGEKDKTPVYEKLLAELKLDDSQVAYIGDDLPDLPLMQRVGLSIAVANAVPVIQQQANWITTKEGGCGAVREACETILAWKK